MKKSVLSLMNLKLLLPLFFVVCFSGCDQEGQTVDIPFTFVNERINLNSLLYKDLRNVGGYIYIPNAGYKGIILIHEETNAYKAFERACTFDPREECSIVEMDESQLFLIDKCCNSSFDFYGNPTGGPASIPLVEYRTYLDGNELVISNE